MWQFNMYAKGMMKSKKTEMKSEISQAWHTAVFNNQKKIEPLDFYLSKLERRDKSNDLEEIEKIKAIDKGAKK